ESAAWNELDGSGSHGNPGGLRMSGTQAGALRALDRDIWVADRPLKLAVGDIGARMTVIRLADGGLFLHSPVPLDAATKRALDELGPVRVVVAPSKVHHLFASE